jgi:formate hydrogenlyase transcriptional activator
MSLNSLTNPLRYEDLRPKTDPEITFDINRMDKPANPESGFEGIIGRSSGLRRVLQMVETVAWGDSTVLLLGETGTGKELIARAIHSHGPRRDRSFAKLNCAAIPTGLLESELFGHERGSFTGAIAQKIGRLELAHQGSLFLDEIGDIPLEIQPKLLRVLQEREFERLGSTRTQKVDVRIVAATHRDLEGMILERQFRSDLYYRLNVFPINVPPLRERQEDIPLLVHHFVQQAARRMHKTIDTVPSETMEALIHYRWPGNIRELENLIERAVILSPGPVLRLSLRDLKSRITPGQNTDRHQTLEEVERNHILKILKETSWVLSGPIGAAARLGLNRSTLYFRMKKLGIARSVESYSDPQRIVVMG